MQAGSDRPHKPGVCLDAITDEHMIGFRCVPVEMNGQTRTGLRDNDGFHRRADGRTDRLFCDPESFQDPDLPINRSTAVAAHGGHNEWPSTQLMEIRDDLFQNQRDVGNPATSRRDGHRLLRAYNLIQIQRLHLRTHGLGDIRDCFATEMLPNIEHSRKSTTHICLADSDSKGKPTVVIR